jgi:hypothetical protein
MSEDSDRLRELLERLGYSQRQAARSLDIDEREFRRMCAGGRPVPRAVMLAMEALVKQKEGGAAP